jgi:hypothetical protein
MFVACELGQLQNAIKKIYDNSGLFYAGVLVSGEYLSETTPDVIGMESIRIWDKWRGWMSS